MAERQRDAKPARSAWLPGARAGVAVLLALAGGAGCQTARPGGPSLPAQSLGMVDEPVPGPKAAWDDLSAPAGRRGPTRPPAVVRPDELTAATALVSFAPPKSAGKTWNGWSIPQTQSPTAIAPDARMLAAAPRRDESVAGVAAAAPVVIPEPAAAPTAPVIPAPMPPVAAADAPTTIPMPMPYVRPEPVVAAPEPAPEPMAAVAPIAEIPAPMDPPAPAPAEPAVVMTAVPAAAPAGPSVDDRLEMPDAAPSVLEPTVTPAAEAVPELTPPPPSMPEGVTAVTPASAAPSEVQLEAASQVSNIPLPNARPGAMATPSLSSSDVSLEPGSQVADLPMPAAPAAGPGLTDVAVEAASQTAGIPAPDAPPVDAPAVPEPTPTPGPTEVQLEAASRISNIPMPGAPVLSAPTPPPASVDVPLEAASRVSDIPMPVPRPAKPPTPAAKPVGGPRPMTTSGLTPTPTPTPTARPTSPVSLSVWRPTDADSLNTSPRTISPPVPNLLMPGP